MESNLDSLLHLSLLQQSSPAYLGGPFRDKSPEHIQKGVLELRAEQTNRHEIFRFYVEEWAFGSYSSWRDFVREGRAKLQLRKIEKPIAPEGSLLASNLQTVLRIVRQHYTSSPDVRNVLLYLHSGADVRRLPKTAGEDFVVVPLDYSEDALDNFVRVRM